MKSRSNSKQTWRIFWKHAMRYKKSVAIIAAGVVLVSAVDVTEPILFGKFVDAINHYFATDDPQLRRTAITLAISLTLLNALNQVIWRSMGFVNSSWQPRVVADLMNSYYGYLHQKAYAFFANTPAGSIIAAASRFIHSYESVDTKLKWSLGRMLIISVFIQVSLFWRLPLYGWIVSAWFVFYALFAYFFARYKQPKDIAAAEQHSNVNTRFADTVGNAVTVKQFAAQEYEDQAFRGLTQRLYELRKAKYNLGQRGEVIQSVAMVILRNGTLLLALSQVLNKTISVGDLILVYMYTGQISDFLWELGKNIADMFENFADASNMTVMMTDPHEVQDRPNAPELKVTKGEIRFDKVNFHYGNGKPVLRDFDLTVAPGERVAIVGTSGAGKTSLIKILLRFLNIQGGRILIDGQDIAHVTQESLRSQIAVVPQHAMPFHRSFRDNIAYGRPDATQAEIEQAAIAAHCHEFILDTDHGYDTLVGERGVKLSGGQQQRIAIARAILKGVQILVLDEATSSLDSKSEALIQDALDNLMAGKTCIVIAHRLSTIKKVDRILVVDNGRIVESGTHEQLLELKGGHYWTQWQIQAGGFESSPNAF